MNGNHFRSTNFGILLLREYPHAAGGFPEPPPIIPDTEVR